MQEAYTCIVRLGDWEMGADASISSHACAYTLLSHAHEPCQSGNWIPSTCTKSFFLQLRI